MIRMKLHIRLAEKRITQKELSEKTGIGKNTISRYYNDTFEKIDKEHLDILCKFFNCKVEDLIEYVDEKKVAESN